MIKSCVVDFIHGWGCMRTDKSYFSYLDLSNFLNNYLQNWALIPMTFQQRWTNLCPEWILGWLWWCPQACCGDKTWWCRDTAGGVIWELFLSSNKCVRSFMVGCYLNQWHWEWLGNLLDHKHTDNIFITTLENAF